MYPYRVEIYTDSEFHKISCDSRMIAQIVADAFRARSEVDIVDIIDSVECKCIRSYCP